MITVRADLSQLTLQTSVSCKSAGGILLHIFHRKGDFVNFPGKTSLFAPDADVFGDRRLVVETNISRFFKTDQLKRLLG